MSILTCQTKPDSAFSQTLRFGMERCLGTFRHNSERGRMLLLKAKSGVFEAYKEYSTMVKTQFGSEIKKLHSDRGGEFTAHDTPEMNGVAERLNYTLVNHIRAMLAVSNLPKSLWGYALKYTTWLKNRVPTKALEREGKTPFEMLHKNKPNLGFARGFGCKVFVKIKAKSKLDPKTEVGRWIGIDENTKGGHFVYWPDKNRVSTEQNVQFVDGTVFVGESNEDDDTTSRKSTLVHPMPPSLIHPIKRHLGRYRLPRTRPARRMLSMRHLPAPIPILFKS